MPLSNPQVPKRLGIVPMAGLLLHGSSGSGKTTLAHAIANETGYPLYTFSVSDVTSTTGASEETIRKVFVEAYQNAPAIIFIDNIDVLAPRRENLKEDLARRIVTQLMRSMDDLRQALQNDDADSLRYVLIIGATTKLHAIDHGVKQSGLFKHEIALREPDEAGRLEILKLIMKRARLDAEVDLLEIARSTSGFLVVHLKALVDNACKLSIGRLTDKTESNLNVRDFLNFYVEAESNFLSLTTTMTDFENAVKIVQSSFRREGFSAIPNVTWDDVGGLSFIKEVFERYIIGPIKHPENYKEFGINLGARFLLFGPTGCGKTLIAKAVANEAGVNFIHIKGAELLEKYVGKNESEVREIFTRARTYSPCIIFFDAVDVITTQRSRGGGWAVEHVLNELLEELDGAGNCQDVYIIGATDRIEVMNPAVYSPGRFEKILYVPFPDADEQVAIMNVHARKKVIDADVDLNAFARADRCNNLTGADLAFLESRYIRQLLSPQPLDEHIIEINCLLIEIRWNPVGLEPINTATFLCVLSSSQPKVLFST